MRLITRSDFDGLICGMLLKEAGIIDSWQFVHPKDLQDGLFQPTKDDVLANVPYVPGCGMWFDHHSSEEDRVGWTQDVPGESRLAPSAARISSAMPYRARRSRWRPSDRRKARSVVACSRHRSRQIAA